MNRIDRISAILIQLQSRRIVKAIDIAERFGISLRTVYRDIRTLEEAGIPIIGEAGVGYSLMDGFRLPPVMFTREEAAAFLTAEKLVEKLTDNNIGQSYKSAMFKIKAVLRSTDKDFLEDIDKHIEVLHSRKPQQKEQPNPNLIQTIIKAIAEKNIVRIAYFAWYKQEKTSRLVEPVGVFYLNSYWHLVAYCHMRKAYRDFRLDRIQNIFITEERYTKQHPSLKDYLKHELDDTSLYSVVLHVDKQAARHLGDQKYFNGYIGESEKDNYIEMNFLTISLDGFARWYLMFADCAKIAEPEGLKERDRRHLSNISREIELL